MTQAEVVVSCCYWVYLAIDSHVIVITFPREEQGTG